MNISAEDTHDLLGVLDKQGPQKKSVYQAENRGVGADSERQYDHRRDGERRLIPKHPDAVTHVFKQISHCLPPPCSI